MCALILIFTHSAQTQTAFKDVTIEAGINHQFQVFEGFLGGGACVLDINNDGYDDIFLTGGVGDDILYLNNKNGTFTNIYEQSGLIGTKSYLTQGVAAADVNRDGFVDLYITTITSKDTKKLIPRAPNQLYINNGNNTFRDATAEFHLDKFNSFSTGANFGDFNADGYPDLYVGNYFTEYPGDLSTINESMIVSANQITEGYLFLNEKGKSFKNVYKDYGLSHKGFGFGGLFTDFDNDGDQDLLINHDFGYKRTPNLLYENKYPWSSFKEIGEKTEMDLKINSMTSAAGDYNNDGWMDYFITNIRFNKFMVNQGADKPFKESSRLLGIDFITISWGANFADFDHDGDLDLFVSNGDLNPNCVPMGDYYFENKDSKFIEMGRAMGLCDYGIGRGSVVLDYDNDGDLDILVVNQKPVLTYPVPSMTHLYRNDSAKGNWIKIKLNGIEAETHGLGSKVEIVVNGKHQIREIDGGGSSHLSQNATNAHFGIGEAIQIDEIIVHWTGGNTQVLKNQKANQVITISEEKSFRLHPFVKWGLMGLFALAGIFYFFVKAKVITMKLRYTSLFCLFSICFICFSACKNTPTEQGQDNSTEKEPALFTLLTPEKTHVDFQNNIVEGLNKNVLMYEYFYNGGGVAVGDINNDGLDEIYFTSNLESNRLYLNKGNMQFEDITVAAGVTGRDGPWKTGTTMADVNGDGLLDIYVCYSGNLPPEKKANQLFINQGNNKFVEKAADYGLNSPATSTQAVFFDYDKDGDLDMFLLNHNPKSLPVLDEASTAEMLKKDDPSNGMRLFRQDKNTNGEPLFKDITIQAGLLSSALSYGLGAAMADYNGDGWTDMYISNDYTVPDFLYINNKKGGFTNQILTSVGHNSQFSMGSDAADINNDALTDIFTLDMLPEDNRRQKLLTAPDNYEKFDFNLKVGFGHQYMRNMLQINQGKVKNELTFSEMGQLSGISNTDWSWSALFADYDNDGWKDLYITNGYLRDYTNLDFLKYMNDYMQNNRNIQRQNVLELVQKIPSSNLNNYMYKNNGNLTFKNVGWGTSKPSNSNGAAYSDLDNDGDLDLIVNNINQAAFIYQNDAEKQVKNHYLKIKLQGEGLNRMGLGAKVTLYYTPFGGKGAGAMQFLEQMPTRGYQSSVSPILHFGLGQTAIIDSLEIVWQSGKTEIIKNIAADKLLTIEEKNASNTTKATPSVSAPIFNEINSPIAFENPKTAINDFKRQPLLTNPLSFVSPCLTKGDVNGDGLEDVYVGGASGQAGALYFNNKNGSFTLKPQAAFEADKQTEDSDAAFFDANGDGFMDLYVCSGGYGNFQPEDANLQDRLYLNDGKGSFTKNLNALPKNLSSKSCVRAADINGDGKPDLFIGGRVIPGRYPEAPLSMLLINDGKGTFTDQTPTLAPTLQKIGMVTDAAWIDLNNDKKPELIIVGEFMPITVFGFNNAKMEDVTTTYFDKKYSGLWNKLLVEDLNGDGKADLVVGNLGLNSQLKASEKEPAELYFKDFDDNGSVDPILCFYNKGKSYPYITRDELLDQMSIMRTRFTDYKSYAEAGIKDIFKSDELKGATRLEANTLKTMLFLSDANNKFQEKPLPIEAQAAPIFTIATLDFNKDGIKDIFLAGNINHARLKFGKYDANYGLLLRGDNNQGQFSAVTQHQAGFRLTGDVRSAIVLKDILILGLNQQALKAYKMK